MTRADEARQQRDETPAQREDRRWSDLLQELRVMQTGVQILFSLLLTVPFAPRFEALTRFQVRTYLAALVLAATAVLALMAPTVMHRVLFAQGDKAFLVRTGSTLSVVGAVLGTLAVCAVLLLIVDVVVGRAEALLLSGLYLLVGSALLFGVGLVRRATVAGR